MSSTLPSPPPGSVAGRGPVTVRVERSGDDLTLSFVGPLDAVLAGEVWRKAVGEMEARPRRLVIDGSAVTYCDGTGAALLLDLRERQAKGGGEVVVQSFRPEFQEMLEL